MGKTKRQLRAEAVERLKARVSSGEPIRDWEYYSLLFGASGETVFRMTHEDIVAALADLLADGEPPYDKLLRCLENDHGIKAKWDGLRKFWAVERAEPRVNNLTWLYGNEPAFRANVNDLAAPYSGRRFSPYHWDEDAREWLMSEHAEFVLNAEKYNFEPESGAESCTGGADVTECSDVQAPDLGFVNKRLRELDACGNETAGRKFPPEGGPGPCGQPSDGIVADSRAKLEADMRNLLFDAHMKAWMWGYENRRGTSFSKLEPEFLALLDRQTAITERECMGDHELTAPVCSECMAGASRLRVDNAELQAKVDALEAENADDARAINSLGEQRDHWQRVAGKNGEEIGKLRKMLEVERNNSEAARKSRDAWMGRFKQAAQLMPVLAHDGQPIEIGQTLYGLSDGKAWTVDGFDRKRPWSVWAHYGEHCKCLKPEWLTHEKPDSLEAIAYDLRKTSSDFSSDVYKRDECGRLDGLADRIEKIGGNA